MTKLTHSELYFLSLLCPDGATISVGTSVGARLRRKGLVAIAKYGRYGITDDGREALVCAEGGGAGTGAAPGKGNRAGWPRRRPTEPGPKRNRTLAANGLETGQLPLI